MFLLETAPRIAGIVLLGAIVVLIHSGIKLNDSFRKSHPSWREHAADFFVPFRFLFRRNQPPQKWKYVDRFLYSALLAAICFIILGLSERLSGTPA